MTRRCVLCGGRGGSAFSAGRASALVCECGAGSTSVVPVVDGFVLLRSLVRGHRGGQWLDGQVMGWMAKKGTQVKPR
jgi:actin-like protein 6A